jgi:hypothetical protein
MTAQMLTIYRGLGKAMPSPEFIQKTKEYIDNLSVDSIRSFITDLRADYTAALELDPATNLERFSGLWRRDSLPSIMYAIVLNRSLGREHEHRFLAVYTPPDTKTRIVERFWIDLREMILMKEGIKTEHHKASEYLKVKPKYESLIQAVDSVDWNALGVEYDANRGQRSPIAFRNDMERLSYNLRPDNFTIPVMEYAKGSKNKQPYLTVTPL